MKSTLKMLVITIALGILFLGILGNVNAEEEEETQEEENTESEKSFWGKMEDFFIDLLDTLLSILLAPFNAIKIIFERWATSLGGWWYAPIIAVFVLAVVWFFIRGITAVDRALDTTE